MVEALIVGLFTLAGVYFGAKIAKGKEIFPDLPKKMRTAVRTEEQEAEVMAKLEKMTGNRGALNEITR